MNVCMHARSRPEICGASEFTYKNGCFLQFVYEINVRPVDHDLPPFPFLQLLHLFPQDLKHVKWL